MAAAAKSTNGADESRSTIEDNDGEIKCRMEPSGATAAEMTLSILTEAGGDRITNVTIKGEDVGHDF